MSTPEQKQINSSQESCLDRQSQEEQLIRIQQSFKIVNPNSYSMCRVIDRLEGVEEEFVEYSFHAKDRVWNIRFPQKIVRPTLLSQEGIYLNGFSETLKDKQDIAHYVRQYDSTHKKSRRKKIDEHDYGPLFFSANWNVLSGMFYMSGINKHNSLPCFTEVDLNEYTELGFPDEKTGKKRKCWGGQADFIGVADQLIIIEFGAMNSSDEKWKKSTQVKRQGRAIVYIWDKHEPDTNNKLLDVFPLTAKYSHTEDMTKIKLLTTSFPFDPKTQELFPTHLPQERVIFAAD